MLFFVGMTVSLVHSVKRNKSNLSVPRGSVWGLNGALCLQTRTRFRGAVCSHYALETATPHHPALWACLLGHRSLEMNRPSGHSPAIPACTGSRLQTHDPLCEV